MISLISCAPRLAQLHVSSVYLFCVIFLAFGMLHSIKAQKSQSTPSSMPATLINAVHTPVVKTASLPAASNAISGSMALHSVTGTTPSVAAAAAAAAAATVVAPAHGGQEAVVSQLPSSTVEPNTWYRYDGIGGLSGGGATSTFLMAYNESYRSQILDWMFRPGYGAALNILKVEIGCDDQTTDGCESCHMRTPHEVNCSRGYEWDLMKAAVARNPNITLYGLPWGFAGWLGFGTTNPYHNVTATADYIAKWVECGRDTHGLNISVLGLWNEAWQAEGRPFSDPVNYALALRLRLDTSGLSHVRLVAPDGAIGSIVPTLKANTSFREAVWALGAHYPGAGGADPSWRADLDNIQLWSAEDYSTYSDATGAGCWGRLLVQNAGQGYAATISWYLIGSFTRGRHYDADGLLRAEWPSSGHWEVTPMAWITMHWTLFAQPGWTVLKCNSNSPSHASSNNGTSVDTSRINPNSSSSSSSSSSGFMTGSSSSSSSGLAAPGPGCKLKGGGNYIVLVSTGAAAAAEQVQSEPRPKAGQGEQHLGQQQADITVIVETFLHSASKCIRKDPSDWSVAPKQTVSIQLPSSSSSGSGNSWHATEEAAAQFPSHLNVWRSCTGWRYPADDDTYMVKQKSINVSALGRATFVAEVNCYYTLTTLSGIKKPVLPKPPPRSTFTHAQNNSSNHNSSGDGAVSNIDGENNYRGSAIEARHKNDMFRHNNSPDQLNPRPAFFPLPFREDFEGATAGGEAPYFGDQEGKWETVPAGGGRAGMASQQQLERNKPWPILEPQCNDHSAPISIIGDMFFESTRVSADILVEEAGVGAGIALRVRISSAIKNVRYNTPGLFLYLGSTPGHISTGGRDNPGGTLPAPNKGKYNNEWTLCADSLCSIVMQNGTLHVSHNRLSTRRTDKARPGLGMPIVGHWHAVTLEVTENIVSGSIDGEVIFSNISVAPPSFASSSLPSPSPLPLLHLHSVEQCVQNTSLLGPDMVIAGGDYKQLVLPPPASNSSAHTHFCAAACCADDHCTAWAVAVDKCWLKNHGWSIEKMPGGEKACGIRPKGPSPRVQIPPSGWVGVAATLGMSQVDNFEIVGTAIGSNDGAAVMPCANDPSPSAGATVVSTPCDYPSTLASWQLKTASSSSSSRKGGSNRGDGSDGDGDGAMELILSDTHLSTGIGGRDGTNLCLGAATARNKEINTGNAVVLVPCLSETALIYNISTGRLMTRVNKSRTSSGSGSGSSSSSSNSQLCLTVTQRTWMDPLALAQTSLSACQEAPSDTQQFQYHPGTGALRPKASVCITSDQGESTSPNYRDCCLALCVL